MAMFLATLKVATKDNNLVHTVIFHHPAEDIDSLCGTLCRAKFIVVDEYYNERPSGHVTPVVVFNKQIILNTADIAKCNLIKDQPKATP